MLGSLAFIQRPLEAVKQRSDVDGLVLLAQTLWT